MTASTLLPSTHLADLQTRIISRTDYTEAEALALYVELDKYRRLLAETHNSNLHVRQAFIMAGLRYIAHAGVPSEDYATAYALMKPLMRDGYWTESADYLDYTAKSIAWWSSVTGIEESDAEINDFRMLQNYLNIVAPDGTIPVPEASRRTYPTAGLPDSITNDKYIVQRWPSGAYLLIDIGAECDTANLHDWLSAGYYALYIDGVWHHRCRPYEHFDWANVLDDSAFRRLLPKGALLPGWRLKPPKVAVVKGEGWVEVTWKNRWMPAVKRRISWHDGVVVVVDLWGWFGKSARSWRVG